MKKVLAALLSILVFYSVNTSVRHTYLFPLLYFCSITHAVAEDAKPDYHKEGTPDRKTAGILALIMFGIHYFYVGHFWTGLFIFLFGPATIVLFIVNLLDAVAIFKMTRQLCFGREEEHLISP